VCSVLKNLNFKTLHVGNVLMELHDVFLSCMCMVLMAKINLMQLEIAQTIAHSIKCTEISLWIEFCIRIIFISYKVIINSSSERERERESESECVYRKGRVSEGIQVK